MRKTTRWLFMLLLCGALPIAHAATASETEVAEENAIRGEVTSAFEQSDWARLDARYAEALRTDRRMPSGLPLAGRMVDALFSERRQPPADLGRVPPRSEDWYWLPAQEKARRWLAASPTSVFPAIALARAHISHAWRHRGNGYAASVAEGDWKNFHANLAKAEEALASRRELGRKDPNWWAALLEVATAKGMPREGFQQLVGAAIDAFPGNYHIYYRAAHGSIPRWGGSYRALADLADEAVRRTRTTDGEAMYAWIYWAIRWSLEPGFLAEGTEVDWPRIRAGFEDIVKKYPTPWNLNAFARHACEARDRKTSRALFERIRSEPVANAWSNRIEYTRCLNWAME